MLFFFFLIHARADFYLRAFFLKREIRNVSFLVQKTNLSTFEIKKRTMRHPIYCYLQLGEQWNQRVKGEERKRWVMREEARQD